jgi:hypothetical protein
MHPFIQRTISVGALTALALTSACSVSSDDDAAAPSATSAPDAGTGTTDAAAPGEPQRGVTDDTIRLGLALIDTDATRETYGVELGNFPDEIITTLEATINEAGGINGRDVQFVVSRFLPVPDEESQATCRELIEDEQVYAVLGTFLGDNALCVTEAHATPYFGGFGLTPEFQDRSQAPFVTLEGDIAESTAASVELLVEEGVLDEAAVAVYSETDYTPELVEAGVLTPLAAGGIDVVSQAQASDFGGDQVAAGNEADLILQRFEADGADTILVAAGLPVILPALSRTDYAPQLVFLNGQIQGNRAVEGYGLTDPAELEGAIAAVAGRTTQEQFDAPITTACIEDINAHSDLAVTEDDLFTAEEQPGSRDFRAIPLVCGIINLAREVLTTAGDDLSTEGLLAALDELGDADLTGQGGGSLSRTDWGVGAPPRLWSFDVETVTFLPTDG